MNSRKSEHNIWAGELKRYFHNLQGDIPYCERCNTTSPPIDIAHSKKRKFIYTREDYFHAVVLCRACHNEIELGKTHEFMYREVSRIRCHEVDDQFQEIG